MKTKKMKTNNRIINEEVSKEKEEIITKMENGQKAEVEVNVQKAKTKYLVCYFCGNKQYDINSADPTGAWCYVCGRCFPPIWQEE